MNPMRATASWWNQGELESSSVGELFLTTLHWYLERVIHFYCTLVDWHFRH
jgi:hypothetical protein